MPHLGIHLIFLLHRRNHLPTARPSHYRHSPPPAARYCRPRGRRAAPPPSSASLCRALPRPLLFFPYPPTKRRRHVHHLSPSPLPPPAAPHRLSGPPRAAPSPSPAPQPSCAARHPLHPLLHPRSTAPTVNPRRHCHLPPPAAACRHSETSPAVAPSSISFAATRGGPAFASRRREPTGAPSSSRAGKLHLSPPPPAGDSRRLGPPVPILTSLPPSLGRPAPRPSFPHRWSSLEAAPAVFSRRHRRRPLPLAAMALGELSLLFPLLRRPLARVVPPSPVVQCVPPPPCWVGRRASLPFCRCGSRPWTTPMVSVHGAAPAAVDRVHRAPSP